MVYKRGTGNRRKKPRTKVPLQRVTAEIQIQSTRDIIQGRVFLTDLSPTGVGLFASASLEKGELVSLVIEQPRHLFVKGEVAWCIPYTLETKIITSETFSYRIGIKFVFETEEEADTLKKYCEEIYASTSNKKKQETPPTE